MRRVESRDDPLRGYPGVERQKRWVALRSILPASIIRHSSFRDFLPCPLTPVPRPPSPPRGMTLIELLVVIIIVTTLVSAAIPLMSPANDDRRLREASRMVNTFISTAQANAIATQRPFGVAIKRLSKDTGRNDPTQPDNDNSVSIELYYVEQPTPFVGFNEQSQARVALYTLPSTSTLYGGAKNLVVIQFVAPGVSLSASIDGLPDGWDADQFASGVVRFGDVIEINGTRYKLMSDKSDTTVYPQFDSTNVFFANNTGYSGSRLVVQIVAQPLNDSGQMIDIRYDNDGYPIGPDRAAFAAVAPSPPPPPFWTNPAPYKILRQPMKTSAEPLQLPEGSAIDLRASGLGDNDYFYVPKVHDNADDILIMFAPEGRVSRLAYNLDPPDTTETPPTSTFDQPVVDNILLLVGKRENAPPPPVATDPTLNSTKLPPAGPNREAQLKDIKKPVNWLRGESRWIVIGSQSGRVVTVENAFVDPATIISNNVTLPPSDEPLRNAQILEAREFIHEMKQLGGR
jgi:prepilin-type N-terminal cleavage/methylation domain-containing protein